MHFWSRRLAEAEMALEKSRAWKLAAAEAHLERMDELHRSILERVAAGRFPEGDKAVAEFYLADAECLVCTIRADPPPMAAFQKAAKKRAVAARRAFEAIWANVLKGRGSQDMAYEFSRNWMEAETALAKERGEHLVAAEAQFGADKKLESLVKKWFLAGRTTIVYAANGTAYRAEAEMAVSNLKANGPGQQGGSKLAKERLEAARATYNGHWQEYVAGRGYITILYDVSFRWLQAAIAVSPNKVEQTAAWDAHRTRMKEVQRLVMYWHAAGRLPTWKTWATEFFIAEADIRLAELRSN